MSKLTDANRLSIVNPELCKEWDYDKNRVLKPHDVCSGSGKRVWWRCKNNHSYNMIIGKRTGYQHHGCPYCSGKKVSDKNRLSIIYPKVSKEWNYSKNIRLAPENVSFGSNKKVWWICGSGHEWESKIGDRCLRSRGCPYCSGQKVNEENCLATVNPMLSKEWNNQRNINVTPKDVTIGSNKKIWWICSKGHEWKASVSNRHHGRDCPYCSNRKVCKDNCLLTVNPKMASEWHPTKNGIVTPEKVIYKSEKGFWWICANGHEWKARILNRYNGNGCPICNKVSLADGTSFDSVTEAYYYLTAIKPKYNDVKMNKNYGMGKFRYDFYIPTTNTYIEVTGYNNLKYNKIWDNYAKIIEIKREYVENKLKANFQFVQIVLTREQIDYVRKNAI